MDTIIFPILPKIEELPDFGLYMDQVMTLMEKQFPKWPLTKTMINNYTKDKILFPSEKKKYSREHLMMLSLIQFLKRTLTLPEIKMLLAPFSKELEKGEKEGLYHLYREFHTRFDSAVVHGETLKNTLMHEDTQPETRVLLSALLASYFQSYAESLVDSSTPAR